MKRVLMVSSFSFELQRLYFFLNTSQAWLSSEIYSNLMAILFFIQIFLPTFVCLNIIRKHHLC